MRALISILCALFLTVASAECFRVLQAASYRPRRGYAKVLLSWYYLSVLVAQMAVLFLCQISVYVTLGIYLVIAIVFCAIKRKCPLKVTKRIVRMLAVEYVCIFTLCYFVAVEYWLWLVPLFVLIAWLICLPIDAAIARHYINKATAKLKESGVTVIAITGSYGKTSVKDMLSRLVANSISPKGSCNTPLGIAQFVNSTELSSYKYLILEFGARQKGDIAQLTRLFKPVYGVLTGVCAQHLSTFKSIDNVLKTKRELPQNLPANGFCVINAADEYYPQLEEAGSCIKYSSYENLQIESLNVGFDGTELSVTFNGQIRVTRLPQISNYVKDTFAMCLQTALRLGQDLDETLARVSEIKQTPHRMQLYKGASCYVLDDSYNGSIVGVKSCCSTLANFHCVKVAITQGLVECGKNCREMNVECGKLLGEACDVAVVLGRNADFLRQGLRQTSCKVLTATSLTQAVQLANQHVNGGIMLFQNDLPDVVNV